MPLTRQAFAAVRDRSQAFTLVLYAIRGQLRTLSQKFVLWLDASGRPGRAEEAELRRVQLLNTAREIQAELALLIDELEAEAVRKEAA